MDPVMNHVVMLGNPAYGHIQGCIPFAAKLVQTTTSPPTITILASDPSFVRLFETEIAKYQLDGPLRQLVRFIAVAAYTPDFAALKDAYHTLHDGKPLKCTLTGVIYPAVPPPSLVIFDHFAYLILPYIRSLTQQAADRNVLCYAWQSGGASGFLRYFGPEYLGGIGNLDEKMTEAGAVDGVDPKLCGEIGDKILLYADGSPLRVPGLAPMYDYEGQPQDVPYVVGISLHARFGHKSFLECDGAIISSSEVIEPDGIQAWRDWFSITKREIFVIYPPEPPYPKVESRSKDQPEPAKETDPNIDEVDQFLLDAIKSHGERSVLYIAFGTIFWPMMPDRVWALFDLLIELQIPFIFAHPGPLTTVPDDVAQKVKDSGLGIMPRWAPQQFILLHPATGWFVTHAGQNSRMESLTAGVPMICWPIHSEQPFNAGQLSVKLNVAYELLQVRSGTHGLKPMRRFEMDSDGKLREDATRPRLDGTLEAAKREFREVFKKARGEDGKEKRRNALDIRERLKMGWMGGGGGEDAGALKEMKRFIRHVGLDS